MCYFLTVGIKKYGTSSLLSKLPSKIQSVPDTNTAFFKYINSGYEMFHLTNGMCSCELYQPHRGVNHDLKKWVKRTVEKLKDIYIFIHWYSQPIDYETISIQGKKLYYLDEFLLLSVNIPENTLIHIIK